MSDEKLTRDDAEKQRRGLEVLREKSEQHGAPVCTTDGKLPNADYAALGAAPKPLKANGQHESYYVLCEEERARGFVRPVRRSYIHAGLQPKYPLRYFTEEEKQRTPASPYVAFESYPESEAPIVGRSWTAKELAGGCGTKTTMGQALAETYARDPKFYGAAFCCGCGSHLQVAEFKWEDGTVVGS